MPAAIGHRTNPRRRRGQRLPTWSTNAWWSTIQNHDVLYQGWGRRTALNALMTRDAATLAVLLISRSTPFWRKNWAARRSEDPLYCRSTAHDEATAARIVWPFHSYR